ncbi:hypothetical protein [Dyella ginsengisoli]|uniref:hypothetical protein n=1 Tax=Dyella ginsengisoli TaxID=363848 RepID=UPI000379108E|nr:hypothetical protein [Dyella ginsengisoli]
MRKEAADRPFFVIAASLFVLLVFLAFAQRYYLGWLFRSPHLSLFLQVHGAIMSGWVLMFIMQTGLVETGHMRMHRKLGTVGAGWAVLVVTIGTMATLHASIREVRAHTDIAPLQVTITGLELVEMLLFAGFVTSAVWLRRRGDYHKRLMLLTLVCMLPSVLPRLPLGLFQSLLSILLAVYGALVLCVGIDTLRHRRLHPAFAIGGAIFVLVMQAAFFAMQTPAWRDFLTRLLG